MNERDFGGNWKKTLDRDGWKCRMCGKDLHGICMAVHHIDGTGVSSGLPVNNDMDNLISYCGSCHMKVHNPRITTPCRVEGCTGRAERVGRCIKHYKHDMHIIHRDKLQRREKEKRHAMIKIWQKEKKVCQQCDHEYYTRDMSHVHTFYPKNFCVNKDKDVCCLSATKQALKIKEDVC